tara:strand:- start:9679 stop:11298 length:1620 start_codon:yes stop_codon:yes gene_type:complete
VSKVDDKKLPLGVALEPSHVTGNLAGVAGNFAAEFVADQRKQAAAPFSISWNLSLISGDQKLFFTLPPLQEHFDVNRISSSATPTIVLDSISFSFDQMNQGDIITASGYPSPNSAGWSDIKVTLSKVTTNPDASSVSTVDGVPEAVQLAELFMSGVDLTANLNTRNPAILRDLSLTIDPYETYQWHIFPPVTPITSCHLRASFNVVVCERDTQTVIGDALNSGTPYPAQNAPVDGLYGRDADSLTLTTPAANSVISAESATTGVQTQLEAIDTKIARRLEAGRFGRFNQSVAATTAYPKEALKEDSFYFCKNVNLLKATEMIRGDNVDGYLMSQNAAVPAPAPQQVLWDKAVIPIPYPMTIHHVFIELAGINDLIRELPGSVSLAQRRFEVGVGILYGVQADSFDYLQVAHLESVLSGATAAPSILKERLFPVPLVYSTHATAGPLGRGWPSQTGRPYYAGRQYQFGAGGNREDVCFVNPALAEGVPLLNGADQYLEVRVTYGADGTAFPSGFPTGATDFYLSESGINVYIIGKMQLQK